jgi:signal transduction histidine kinase/ligand-binding sensor domain-containing protein
MWFGTDGGLARFDGRRTQTIADPALPQGRILALKNDEDGTLWIGTETGAARLSGDKFDAIPATTGKAITAIIAPEHGRVLMATEQGLIFEWHKKEEGTLDGRSLLTEPLQSADADHPGPLALTSLAFANGKVFAGSLSRGLLRIENSEAKEVQLRPANYFLRALETDASGNLWIGTRSRKEENGVFRGSESTAPTSITAPTGTVMTIRAAGEDVWVGTDGRGVFRFSGSKKPQRFTFDGTAGGLRSDHVYSIFVDREDVVWFGTDRGVCRFDSHAPRAEAVSDNPESNFVRTLYQTSDNRVLAGTNRGLFVYDDASSTWNSVSNLARNIIYSIAQDKVGRLLVGSASGLYVGEQSAEKIEERSFKRVEVSPGNADAVGSIRAITQFRGATYVASFKRGLERLEEQGVRLVWPNEAAGTREVISLFADGDARLLIGMANEGVLSFDGQKAQAEPALARLKGATVRSIEKTGDGSFWFATNRGVYFCKTGVDCLLAAPDFDARSIRADRSSTKTEGADSVWCATTGGGLLKIRADDQFGPILSQLDAEQGLPSQNVFAVYPQPESGSKESFLIGTSRGIVRYQPGTLAPTLYATRIISKRVHQPGELAGGLSLEYPQNSLLFEVAAISSRTFPEQFQYGFILSDANDKIIKRKLSRESQFPMEGLKPGRYKVLARAFSKDLIPSTPLTFEFSIAGAPFPWTSTALAVFLILALLALLWALLERKRIVQTSAALVAANQELADARLNLANEAERERRRIARDLHDQTLADLRHLLLLTDQLPANDSQSGSKQLDPAVLRTEIESISQEVRRICEDLSPSVLQNVGFSAALEFALSHAVQDAPSNKRFQYEFVCDESLEERTQLPPNVQMQIYRIVQEAVNNIWRHAGATRVKMIVNASPSGDFLLQLRDNGEDFDPLEQKNVRGRGLANMRARASLIDAEISWEKVDGAGTVFTLQLKRAGRSGVSLPNCEMTNEK